MSADESDPDLLDELAEEFIERYRRGERPSVDEYESRCPRYAAEIRDLFPALVVMEQAASVDAGPESFAQQTAPSDATGEFLSAMTQVGDYRIIREIGRGGMGVVFEAEQMSLGRHVALKVLPRQTMTGTSERRRFEREAKAAARLHHTNIVPVFGVGEQDGLHYYVMQFIHGLGLDDVLAELRSIWKADGGFGDLPSNLQVQERGSGSGTSLVSARRFAQTLIIGNSWIEQTEPEESFIAEHDSADGGKQSGRLSDSFSVSSSTLSGTPAPPHSDTPPADGSTSQSYWVSVARIGSEVAEGLQYAHEQGVLHRDIKPSNLLLDTNGTVWIADFGLAKADDQDNLTNTGDIIGTLRYMAPENFSGTADVRSEVYALGLTLYEMVALRPAFDETDRNRLLKQVTTEPPGRVERFNPRVPRDLATIVNKAVEFDPAHRYQTAGELAEDLQRFINDEPIKARQVSGFERLQRWSRQNRALAGSLFAVLLLLVIVAAGASLAAVNFRELAGERESALRDAVRAQNAAEASRTKMQIAISDIAASNGLIAADRGTRSAGHSGPPVERDDDSAEAVLWFANAARYAAVDPERELANRVRVHNWLRETIVPVRAFTHRGTLQSIQFDSTGQFLLALENEHCVVRDWHAESRLSWIGKDRRISTAAWSPDGSQLALAIAPDSGGGPVAIELRRMPDGRLLHQYEHPQQVSSLLFSPDGGQLAFASTAVELVDLASHESLITWSHPHDQAVHSLIFNPRGHQLAAASRDKQVRVFAIPETADQSAASPAPLFAPIRHEPQSAPAYVTGGAGLITAVSYRELLWSDAETGKPDRWKKFKTQQSMFTTLKSSPDGRFFAAGGYDSVYEWESDKETPADVHMRHRNHTMDVAYSADGGTLLTSSWDGKAKLWTHGGERIGQPLFHQGKVLNVACSPDGRHIATGQGGGLIRVWALPEVIPDDFAMQVAPGDLTARVSPDGRFVFATRFDQFGWPYKTRRLQVFDVKSGQPAGPVLSLTGQMRDGAISPNSSMLATVTRTQDETRGHLELWDFRTGDRLIPAVELNADPQSVVFSPDKSVLAIFCGDGTLLIQDAKTGEQRSRIQHKVLQGPAHTRAVRFTVDGMNVVAIGPRAVSVWGVKSGELKFPPIRFSGKVKAAIAPDGSFVATGTQVTSLLQVWSLETGEPLCEAIPHPDHIFQLCISHDGTQLFSAGRDGQARLWDWKTGRLVCPPLDHPDEVSDVALTPDGRWGLTACRDSMVRLWDLKIGKPIAPELRCGTRSATSVAITLDGDRAILGGLGSTLNTINLAERLRSREVSVDELCLYAEVVSGQQIVDGNLSRLSTADWLSRWEQWRSGRRQLPQTTGAGAP